MLTIEEIQAELQEEIDLCNKYFIEEDMHKESTEHERLALKIVTMCMQTLSALKDGELEDYKHIKQWKSDVMDGFCKYDCNSLEEVYKRGYGKALFDIKAKMKEINNVTKPVEGVIENGWGTRFVDLAYINKITEQLKVGITND